MLADGDCTVTLVQPGPQTLDLVVEIVRCSRLSYFTVLPGKWVVE